MTLVRKSLLVPILILTLFLGHESALSRVSAQWLRDQMIWSPDSTRLAVRIDDGALIIENGRVISRCFMDGTVTTLSFTPDSDSVYLGSSDGRILVCDAVKGRLPGMPEQSLPKPESINHIAFNADGSRLMVNTGTQSPESLYLYDDAMTLLGQYDPYGYFRPSPSFLPDGSVLIFSRKDNLISVTQDDVPLSEITFTGEANEISLTPDRRYLLMHLIDEGIGVFDVMTGEHVRTFAGFTSGGSFINDYASLSTPTHRLIAHIVTGEIVIEFGSSAVDKPLVFPAYSGSGLLIQEKGSETSTLFRYGTRPSTIINVNAQQYDYFSFFMDKNMLLFGRKGMNTEIVAVPLDGETATIQSLNQSIDYSPLAAGKNVFVMFYPQHMMVFDINTGETVHERLIDEVSIIGFAPSPNGERYAVRGEDMILIQDLIGEEYMIALP